MTCPECGEQMRTREMYFPDCPYCGFELFDADTLALQAEVRREQVMCKAILGHVPTLAEAVEKGLVKP